MYNRQSIYLHKYQLVELPTGMDRTAWACIQGDALCTQGVEWLHTLVDVSLADIVPRLYRYLQETSQRLLHVIS